MKLLTKTGQYTNDESWGQYKPSKDKQDSNDQVCCCKESMKNNLKLVKVSLKN